MQSGYDSWRDPKVHQKEETCGKGGQEKNADPNSEEGLQFRNEIRRQKEWYEENLRERKEAPLDSELGK